MTRPNGLVLQEDPTRVVIVTGLARPSQNLKTGPMLQIWILHRNQSPLQAIDSGADREVCGSCPLRGLYGKERGCYVQLGQAPEAIFRAYQRGSYPAWDGSLDPFQGQAIRFGAYGDPAFIDRTTVERLTSVANTWSGYTHQWRDQTHAWTRRYFMASCDTIQDRRDAEALGFRWFGLHVPGTDSGDIERTTDGAVQCPADQGLNTCSECSLCRGTTSGAKSIWIPPHGAGKAHAIAQSVN